MDHAQTWTPDDELQDAAVAACAGRVVVGHDGSEPARAALAWAIETAQATGVQVSVLRVFTVLEGLRAVDLPTGSPLPPLPELASAVRQVLSGELGDDSPVEVVAVHGRASQVLLSVSQVARQLVVGADRHGVLTGVLRGSVVPGLLARAGCPVTVVPA